MFRVFLGAPSRADITQDTSLYRWQTIESKSNSTAATQTQYLILAPESAEAASRRISKMYENVIFDDLDEDEEKLVEGSVFPGVGDLSTRITWAPTPTGCEQQDVSDHPFVDVSRSIIEIEDTQDTYSFNYSDASSIARFPSFNFDLHSLTCLSVLTKGPVPNSGKVNLLLALLEVEGPDTIRIKKGPDAGSEASILKMILGDNEGFVCKLTAWREIAEKWGGADDTPAAKRGDIIFLGNVTATKETSTSPMLTASPYLKSQMQICYRTMPYTHEDSRLRPDLRLGYSDAAVRKVASLVAWFENMAGLNT